MNAISLKKVTSRGKRYVYLRGTGIALVRGFEGTEVELDTLLASPQISREIEAHTTANATMFGWRLDAAKTLHKITMGRAKQKQRTYSLSVATIAGMLSDAGDRCEVTGLKFDYRAKSDPDWKARPMAPSLDRISNKGGYERHNVRLVCACVNVAINEWGLENFERVCRAFVERNGR